MTDKNTTAPAAVTFNDENAQLKAELERLKKENVALATKAVNEKKEGSISMKSLAPHVNEAGKDAGGNVSIYGLGRFPVTLFLSQIVSLFKPTTVLSILEFTMANVGHLKSKGKTQAEADAAKVKHQAELAALIVAYKKIV